LRFAEPLCREAEEDE